VIVNRNHGTLDPNPDRDPDAPKPSAIGQRAAQTGPACDDADDYDATMLIAIYLGLTHPF